MAELPGSSWGVWDLQIQTILDDGYVELNDYYADLKATSQEKWDAFISLVGSEQDALLFDSKQYFHQGEPSPRHRCDSYAKTLFSFLKVYSPHLKCIGVTDHNHIHDELLDSLVRVSKDFDCKVLPGVEINVGGIHLLAYFPKPPCNKTTYGDGVKTFLATLGIYNIKTNGVLSLAQGSVQEVLDKITEQHGLFIFAHCNSSNGLFQERTRTDRTHLAEIFNYTTPVLLQTRSKEKGDEVTKYIQSNQALKSAHIMTIATDGRALRDYGRPDGNGNYCFIKGTPAVEGLRQAMHEPASRILLGPNAPIPPIHRIDRLDLSFPDGTKVNDDQFCLAGKRTITFSPNYTCFIGGRGTGKSTLLNLIQEKVSPKASAQFSNRKLISPEGKVLVTGDFAKLDDDLDRKTVDFLSQNEIEKFATNAQALTAALYSRLEKENQGKLKKVQEALAGQVSDFQNHIDSFVEKQSLLEVISRLEKEKLSQEKILNSFQSEAYKALSQEVANRSGSLRYLQTSKQRLNKIATDIDKLFPQVTAKQESSQEKNEYDVAFESIQNLLSQAKDVIEALDRAKLKASEDQLENDLQDAKSRLSAYLSEKGLKPESQQDVADANENISRLKTEIEEAQNQLADISKRVDSFQVSALAEAKAHYEATITEQVRSINVRLSNLNAQVKPIKLEFRFDQDAAKRAIFEEVKKIFSLNPPELGTREAALQEQLFCIEPGELNLREKFIETLEQRPKGRELTKAQIVLIELFQKENNFELYKLIVRKVLSDSFSYKVISVYYDGKLLQESSFGQRCTAALVLLLLLGNHPIIIDEPEGHLDSLLIANYLVDLIKKRENKYRRHE